jgi:signal transduction histidine kinase
VCRRFLPFELTADGSRWAFAVEEARWIAPQRTTSFLNAYGIDEPKHTGAFTIASPVLIPIAYRRDRFHTVSAARVLQGHDLEQLAGHPVLIGFGSTEISDRLMTPISGELPTAGVEINAQILDSILSAREVREAPSWLTLVLGLVSCPLLIALFRRLHSWPSVTLVFLIGMVVYGIAFLTFVLGSYLMPVGSILTAVILAPLMTSSADFLVVERSLTLQLRELQRWLFSLNRRSGEQTSGLSWKLKTLEHLQAELGALYELHRALLESTQDAVAIFDGEDQLILRNQHFAALLETPPGRPVQLAEILSRLTASGDAVDHGNLDEEVLIRGSLYAGRTAALPPTTMSPRGGTILTLTSLQTRQERDRARAEALGFLTHELRTPLASIQQFAELMMRYPDSPSCIGAPETIFRESKRLLALISSYLDVLRLDAGARPLRTDDVDMEAVVTDVFDILRPLAAAAEMKLRLVAGMAVTAIGDGPLLTGAVLNLVSNAIKYGTPGSEIHVCCEAAEQVVVLRVSNEALTISEEDLPRLFEAHYRSPSAEATAPGWGLGLAFVKRIAEKHGGSVCATSQGSRIAFEMYLPARAVIPVAGELA